MSQPLAPFRYSQMPGSNNAPIIPSRECLIAEYAPSFNINGFVSRLEQAIIFMDLDGDVIFNDSANTAAQANKNFRGDRLTIMVTGSHAVSFGVGFANDSGSPEQPSGTPGTQAVFEFIQSGNLWMLTNYQIF